MDYELSSPGPRTIQGTPCDMYLHTKNEVSMSRGSKVIA